jgi:hypothetical protein
MACFDSCCRWGKARQTGRCGFTTLVVKADMAFTGPIPAIRHAGGSLKEVKRSVHEGMAV